MKVFRTVFGVIIALAVILTVFIGKYKITEKKPLPEISDYKGIITLWQIDSFEGGSGSRREFLLEASRGFEKENSGVLVMVVNHSKVSAEENMSNGIFPDLISYGNGVNVSNLSEIKTDYKFKGGMVGDKVYAVPWCRGSYYIIENPDYSESRIRKKTNAYKTVVSCCDYTLPLISALDGKTELGSFETKKPLDAYVDFVSDRVKYLIGTQRDVVRLYNRGKSAVITPLEFYNDLYQYVSVVSSSFDKSIYAERFVNYLLSEKVQKKLSEISMSSCFYKVEFDISSLNDMQNTEYLNTISAFSSISLIEELRENSYFAVKGETERINKIKNVLI